MPSSPTNENLVTASLSVRLGSEQVLQMVRCIAGLRGGVVLQGKPEENFAFDAQLRVETRTAMAANNAG
jgi:hypothetical protein